MESAEHTLNALNVEKENKMEKKNVPQRIKDIWLSAARPRPRRALFPLYHSQRNLSREKREKN